MGGTSSRDAPSQDGDPGTSSWRDPYWRLEAIGWPSITTAATQEDERWKLIEDASSPCLLRAATEHARRSSEELVNSVRRISKDAADMLERAEIAKVLEQQRQLVRHNPPAGADTNDPQHDISVTPTPLSERPVYRRRQEVFKSLRVPCADDIRVPTEGRTPRINRAEAEEHGGKRADLVVVTPPKSLDKAVASCDMPSPTDVTSLNLSMRDSSDFLRMYQPFTMRHRRKSKQ